jgi:HK97 family phage major capsid protein
MTPLSKLRAERDKLSAKATEINERTPKNARMPAADAAELDGLLDRIESIDAEITALNSDMQDEGGASAPGSGEAWRSPEGNVVRVLRTAKDFRAHYRSQPGGAFASDQGGPGGAFDLSDFIRGVAGMKSPGAVQAALSEGTNSAGGYTVPNVLMPNILEALVPNSSLLQAGAGIVPMELGGKDFTTAAIQTIPTAAWRAEAGAVATSDPVFRAVVATPRSLAFQFKVSRELLGDSRNLLAGLYIAIGQAFAKELDRAGLRGTGTAPEPRGILNTVGIQTVTNGAAGASIATTAYANFVSALQALLAADAPKPTAAIMAPRSFTTLAGLLDANDQPRQVPPVLRDWKMLTSSQIPTNLTVGASVDCSEIYVGDFTMIKFLMRENVSIMMAKELHAGTGELAFFCHVRADVVVEYPAAVAVVTGVRA